MTFKKDIDAEEYIIPEACMYRLKFIAITEISDNCGQIER